MGEEVGSFLNLKRWVAEEIFPAFPDMRIAIIDGFGEGNRLAIMWTLKATREKDFADFLPLIRDWESVEKSSFSGRQNKGGMDFEWYVCIGPVIIVFKVIYSSMFIGIGILE